MTSLRATLLARADAHAGIDQSDVIAVRLLGALPDATAANPRFARASRFLADTDAREDAQHRVAQVAALTVGQGSPLPALLALLACAALGESELDLDGSSARQTASRGTPST